METGTPIISPENPTDAINFPDTTKTNNKNKHLARIILIAVGSTLLFSLVISLILILIFMGLVSNAEKNVPRLEEYQSYLENKYGTDKDFYNLGEPNCNWFETGECSYLFSSNELSGASFHVTSKRKYYDSGKTEYVFEDDYEQTKEFETLKLKYNEFLVGAIPYAFQLELRQFSFEQNPTLNIIVKYSDIPDINAIDFVALRQSILNAIPEQYVKDLSIEFEVIIYDNGIEYGHLEECPDSFDRGSYGSEGANSCSIDIKKL